MYVLEIGDLEFEFIEVNRAMGNGAATGEINNNVKEVVDQVLPIATKLIHARCVYDIVSIEVIDKTQVLLNGNVTLNTPSRFFQGACSVAVAVVTIGSELEQEVTSLFKGKEYFEALALNAYGSVALDKGVGFLRKILSDQAPDKKLGHSLSPGCQRIPIQDQKVIFSLIESEKIGVRLSESFQMFPVKSSSVIIPIGEDLIMPSESTYSCELCDIHNKCIYARQKLKP